MVFRLNLFVQNSDKQHQQIDHSHRVSYFSIVVKPGASRHERERMPSFMDEKMIGVQLEKLLTSKQTIYIVVPAPSERRDAAAAAAVGTTPVDIPGFDKCSSL